MQDDPVPERITNAEAKPRAVLIAGPTASGKSAFARALARRWNGVVINTDSMQVYRELRLLTARPTPEDEEEAPHRLYGHVGAAQPYSVGRWLVDAAAALDEARALGRVPIFVGGTGLYFTALTEGLVATPPVPAPLRSAVRGRLDAEGPAALHAELARRDPGMAARLRPSDTQRIARALEVLEATGRSLAWFQDGAKTALVPDEDILRIVLAPPRPELYAAIDARFAGMVATGGLDEAGALAALGLAPDAPALKILGVAPLLEARAGRMTVAEAVAAGQLASRRYAKRQLTWARSRMISWKWLEEKYSERVFGKIFSEIICSS